MNPFPLNALGNTPVFHTQRLVLRPLKAEDAQEIYALRSDPENFKYVDFTPYSDLARAERFIASALSDMSENTIHFWAICLADKDVLIGTICLWQYSEQPNCAEFGYEIMKSYQGYGYAGEVMAEIIHFAFESIRLHQLLAITHRDNLPSLALLNRHGFHPVGVMLDMDPTCGEAPEMMLYSLVSELM